MSGPPVRHQRHFLLSNAEDRRLQTAGGRAGGCRMKNALSLAVDRVYTPWGVRVARNVLYDWYRPRGSLKVVKYQPKSLAAILRHSRWEIYCEKKKVNRFVRLKHWDSTFKHYNLHWSQIFSIFVYFCIITELFRLLTPFLLFVNNKCLIQLFCTVHNFICDHFLQIISLKTWLKFCGDQSSMYDRLTCLVASWSRSPEMFRAKKNLLHCMRMWRRRLYHNAHKDRLESSSEVLQT